jgi:hypothetical protein
MIDEQVQWAQEAMHREPPYLLNLAYIDQKSSKNGNKMDVCTPEQKSSAKHFQTTQFTGRLE